MVEREFDGFELLFLFGVVDVFGFLELEPNDLFGRFVNGVVFDLEKNLLMILD